MCAAYRAGSRWDDFRSPVEPGTDNAAWVPKYLSAIDPPRAQYAPIEVTSNDQDRAGDAARRPGRLEDETRNEELYNNVRVYAGTTVLARNPVAAAA